MERWQHAFAQNGDVFKRLFGGKKEIFLPRLDVLTNAREKRRPQGGRRPKLSVADQLFLTLQSWQEYRTMKHIAYDFGVVSRTVSDTIRLVENVLIQDGTFH